MATKVYAVGFKELGLDLQEMQRIIRDEPELITRRLDEGMVRVVHVITGYLKSTIYHKGMVAGAKAPYAGYEDDRGSNHSFAQRAIDNFNIDGYADDVVEPW